MWESAGGRVSDALDGAAAVAVLGDDPVATASTAIGIALAQARTRRVYLLDLLGEGSALATLVPGDDPHGVSDMVHFGVSLGRAARVVEESTPNLLLVPGGAESPLSEEILSSPRWESLFAQVRRSGALALVAAPAIVPGLDRLTVRTDGVVLVGGAQPPGTGVTVLGEVRAASGLRAITTPAATAPAISPSRRGAPTGLVLTVLLFILIAAGVVTAPRWLPMVGVGRRAAEAPPAAQPVLAPAPQRPTDAESDAGYGVQLLFTNSFANANRYLQRTAPFLPALTYAPVPMAPRGAPAADSLSARADSATWYRLVAGAFPDSAAAEGFLQALRASGRLRTGAGSVVHAPFALLVDSAQSDTVARVRLSAYRSRGVPAYALRDSAGTVRIYAGAFATERDGHRLRLRLDSLNIQSVLARRTGSAS